MIIIRPAEEQAADAVAHIPGKQHELALTLMTHLGAQISQLII